MPDTLSDLSRALEARVAEAKRLVAAISWGSRGQLSALLWHQGILVTSEQNLPDAERYDVVLPGGHRAGATLVGRDPTTNVAAVRLAEAASDGAVAMQTATPRGPGGLVLAIGSDGEGGATARLGGIEVQGPAWTSMKGGRIDHLIRLGVRLPSGAEGGPVVDAEGGVLGMSTFGPQRSVMVIPTATVARAVEQLQTQGRVARGWLGLGLHEVALPHDIATRTGVESGLMVMGLAERAPCAGQVLPGDILTALSGTRVATVRAVAQALGPETVGQPMQIDLLRGGEPRAVSVVIAARP
jgi:S1-C subfamily serine protease